MLIVLASMLVLIHAPYRSPSTAAPGRGAGLAGSQGGGIPLKQAGRRTGDALRHRGLA